MYSGSGQFYENKTAYFGWPAGIEENNPQQIFQESHQRLPNG